MSKLNTSSSVGGVTKAPTRASFPVVAALATGILLGGSAGKATAQTVDPDPLDTTAQGEMLAAQDARIKALTNISTDGADRLGSIQNDFAGQLGSIGGISVDIKKCPKVGNILLEDAKNTQDRTIGQMVGVLKTIAELDKSCGRITGIRGPGPFTEAVGDLTTATEALIKAMNQPVNQKDIVVIAVSLQAAIQQALTAVQKTQESINSLENRALSKEESIAASQKQSLEAVKTAVSANLGLMRGMLEQVGTRVGMVSNDIKTRTEAAQTDYNTQETNAKAGSAKRKLDAQTAQAWKETQATMQEWAIVGAEVLAGIGIIIGAVFAGKGVRNALKNRKEAKEKAREERYELDRRAVIDSFSNLRNTLNEIVWGFQQNLQAVQEPAEVTAAVAQILKDIDGKIREAVESLHSQVVISDARIADDINKRQPVVRKNAVEEVDTIASAVLTRIGQEKQAARSKAIEEAISGIRESFEQSVQTGVASIHAVTDYALLETVITRVMAELETHISRIEASLLPLEATEDPAWTGIRNQARLDTYHAAKTVRSNISQMHNTATVLGDSTWKGLTTISSKNGFSDVRGVNYAVTNAHDELSHPGTPGYQMLADAINEQVVLIYKQFPQLRDTSASIQKKVGIWMYGHVRQNGARQEDMQGDIRAHVESFAELILPTLLQILETRSREIMQNSQYSAHASSLSQDEVSKWKPFIKRNVLDSYVTPVS